MERSNLHVHGRQRAGLPAFPALPPVQPLPASPTLTNPDMILPEYCQTVPDLDLDGGWKKFHAASAADLQQMQMFALHVANTSAGSGYQLDPFGRTGPNAPNTLNTLNTLNTPITPIIYGNGTMLSDIGEVTEVESTSGRSPPRARGRRERERDRDRDRDYNRDHSPSRNSGSDSTTQGIQGIGRAMTQKRGALTARERRSSIDSHSTITNDEPATRLFPDVDETRSVGDSLFQGDDEESCASICVDTPPAQDANRLGIHFMGGADRLSTHSIHSTTSISRRAEAILESAKKRLLHMEGNLTRARGTLPSPGLSSDGASSTFPSQRAYGRDRGNPSPRLNSGHARISSDIAMRNGIPYRVSTPRSSSALGTAAGFRQDRQDRQDLTSSKSVDQIQYREDDMVRLRRTVKDSRPLGILTEDDASHGIEHGIGHDQSRRDAQFDRLLFPSDTPFPAQLPSPASSSSTGSRGLQRSASTAQMRDIKDQVKDLKGKISSLRERARVEKLKRRSLQSLRTPSPFTHSPVEQWYAAPVARPAGTVPSTGLGLDGLPARNPWNGEEESVYGDVSAGEGCPYHSDYLNDPRLSTRQSSQQRPGGVPSASTTPREEDASYPEVLPVGFHDALDLGFESDDGESTYHEATEHPVSHEDREDAFDYEHFFLHSAMGNPSRAARRDSFETCTSLESTKTTRATVQDDAATKPSRSVTRRRSAASISTVGTFKTTSTVDTFETADEGASTRSGRSGSSEASLDGNFHVCFEETRPSQPAGSDRQKMPETTGYRSITPARSRQSDQNPVMGRRRDDSGSIEAIPQAIPEAIPEESDTPRSVISQQKDGYRRPTPPSVTKSRHRPSVSSVASTGTTRSFPLVNKAKRSSGILTPDSTPDQELRTISDTLLTETVGVCELQQQHSGHGKQQSHHRPSDSVGSFSSVLSGRLAANSKAPHPMQAMLREDQILVERLVASLGRCVLGLTENGRASQQSRMHRSRIEMARNILEGLQGPEVLEELRALRELREARELEGRNTKAA